MSRIFEDANALHIDNCQVLRLSKQLGLSKLARHFLGASRSNIEKHTETVAILVRDEQAPFRIAS